MSQNFNMCVRVHHTGSIADGYQWLLINHAHCERERERWEMENVCHD